MSAQRSVCGPATTADGGVVRVKDHLGDRQGAPLSPRRPRLCCRSKPGSAFGPDRATCLGWVPTHGPDARQHPKWRRSPPDRRPWDRDARPLRGRTRGILESDARGRRSDGGRLAVRLRLADLEPGVPLHRRHRTGRIFGWHRRFCLWTHLGRGCPERPGLVLGLERGGSCRGVVFHIAPEVVEEELEIVWRREMISGAYVPRWVEVHTAVGRGAGDRLRDQPRPRALRARPRDEEVAEVIATAERLARPLRRLPGQHRRPPRRARHPRPPARAPARPSRSASRQFGLSVCLSSDRGWVWLGRSRALPTTSPRCRTYVLGGNRFQQRSRRGSEAKER